MRNLDFLLHQRLYSFEEFCEKARHWDLDYYQLDRGGFSSELLMFGNTTTLFTRAILRRRLLQKGTPPHGLVTFGVLADPGISIHWRNHEISGDRILVFPPNGELHSVSQANFDVFTVSLSEESLNRTCHFLELPDFRKLIGQNEVFDCHSHWMALLREWLKKITLRIGKGSSAELGRVNLLQLEEDLAGRLISILSDSQAAINKPLSRKRDKALRLAVDFIVDTDKPVTSIQELCSIAGASERTLQYAFSERFGQSPKTFTLNYRLNRVRKVLRRAAPDGARIYRVAEEQGFSHMGQFTHDYKRLFGELPSETLRRSKVPVS